MKTIDQNAKSSALYTLGGVRGSLPRGHFQLSWKTSFPSFPPVSPVALSRDSPVYLDSV